MSFRRKIKSFLVQQLHISNRDADRLLKSGVICIDGKSVTENVLLDEESEVRNNNSLLRERKKYLYYLFHKPRGIESTLNKTVPGNLLQFMPAGASLYPVGRLDKESEGLMLLTNDGKLYKAIAESETEKEYIVDTDNDLPENFKAGMESGMELGGKKTKPCVIDVLNAKKFRIVLTEGKYRQIRRMCHRFGLKVIRLQRIRIDNWQLGELKTGELKEIKNPRHFIETGI